MNVNPITRLDYPDLDVIRVEDTYYMVSTTLPTSEEIKELQTDYNNMLTAIIDLLDGAKYLWEGEHHETQ